MNIDPIQIQGLAEFRRALKAVDAALPKTLRKAHNSAAELIVQAARPQVPRHTGRAAKSIRARSTQTAARVIGGGRRVPYYPWLDFGGKAGPNKSVHRPFISDGRYIYASYYERRDDVQAALVDALTGVVRAAGLEVVSRGA